MSNARRRSEGRAKELGGNEILDDEEMAARCKVREIRGELRQKTNR